MRLRFGLGAWSNRHFDHILYPLRTPHRERLGRYASVFPVAEADILHHQMPGPELASWVEQTPAGFRFLPKMHKDVTHGPDPLRPPVRVEAFLDALEPLRQAKRLGPILLQYAKDFYFGSSALSALEQVLASAPRATFAVELRHPSWWQEPTRGVLERHAAQLVWSTYDRAAAPDWCTGPVGYVRFVGTTGKTRDRWVHKRDRLEDLLAMRARLTEARAAGLWKECFVIVTNRFEGNAVDSLPRIAAALGETELAKRCTRAPGSVLFP